MAGKSDPASIVLAFNESSSSLGGSDCSEPALAGPALWTAIVRDGAVAEWRVHADTGHPGAVESRGSAGVGVDPAPR